MSATRFLTMGVAIALCLLGVMGSSASASPSRILYVSAQAGARGRGTRTRPYRSLKRAIAVARDGATVRVTRGTYEGDLVIKKRTLTVIGGYVGTHFDRRDIVKARSVIQGTGRDAVVSLIRAGKTRIDGFVIAGGGGSTRDDPKASHGGGVYVMGGAPTIAHCLIEKNRTTRKGSDIEEAGGGVFAREGDLVLEDSVIRANISKRGAGIALFEMRHAKIRRNVIEDNIALGDHGGGVYAICRDLVIAGNLVRRNEVGRKIGYGWGGGVATISKGTRVRFSKNIVTGNFAASLGSGYFIDDESDAVIEQDLIVGNRCAPEGGTAIFVDGLDPTKGSRARIIGTSIVNHPCAGVAKGNAVHADQHSSVTIVRSVIWNNGDRALSMGKRAKITIARSIIQEKRFSGEGVVHD
ncbi:MAG: right-handed parallel beta-helix repeat-containing protein, partial [Deltaproteobacteria bacterium]|nr:right-handed parallel beta-helix repeat-containing protein [Deltaproteobacteria bacterium]